MLRKNKVKEILSAGGVAFGCFIRTPSVDMVEMLGCSGFDFVVIDTEHGSINPERVTDLLLTIEATGKVGVVRVSDNSESLIMHALDVGAMAIHIPRIMSQRDALKAVRALRYPPEGERGVALVTRAAEYGVMSKEDYLKFVRQEIMTIIAIEHVQTVKELPEILSVGGIDVVFIGHSDLAGSLGLIGQIDHPSVQKTIDEILNQVVKRGIAPGIPAYTPEAAQRRINQGFRYITTTAEGLFVKTCQDYLRNRVKSSG